MSIKPATLVLVSFVLLSCVAPALRTFAWSNDTSTWMTHNLNGLQVKYPHELPVVRYKQTTTAFAISGYEGNRSTDYLGLVVGNGVYVDYPVRKSLEMLRESVLAKDGKIIGEPKAADTFQYLFPVSSEIDQKTGKKLIPSIVTVSSLGWYFKTAEGTVCGIRLQKWHAPVEYSNWKPESVMTKEEIELLDKVYRSVR